MKRYSVMLMLILSAALSACVVAHSGGQTLVETDGKINRMAVLVQSAYFSKGNTASSIGNRDVADLFPYFAERIPAVFALNHIASKAVYVGADPGVPSELKGFRYVLRVRPDSSSWNSSGGSTLTIGAELADQVGPKVVWRGTVSFGTRFYGKFDAALADQLTGKLLAQLNEDGVIKLRTKKPLISAPLDATAGAASGAAGASPDKAIAK